MERYLFLVIVMILAGCSKETVNPNEENLLLKKVTLNGNTKREYEYDDQNRIAKGTYYYSDGSIFSIRDYEYNLDTIKVVYNFPPLQTPTEIEVLYNIKYSNNSFKSVHLTGNNSIFRTIVFEYSNNGCSTGHKEVYGYSYRLDYVSNYTFIDDNCSTIIRTDNLLDNTHYTQEFYRNDKHRADQSTDLYIYKAENLGCITKYVYKDNNDYLADGISYSSEYEYNSKNYPIKETRTYESGNIEVYEYEYY